MGGIERGFLLCGIGAGWIRNATEGKHSVAFHRQANASSGNRREHFACGLRHTCEKCAGDNAVADIECVQIGDGEQRFYVVQRKTMPGIHLEPERCCVGCRIVKCFKFTLQRITCGIGIRACVQLDIGRIQRGCRL